MHDDPELAVGNRRGNWPPNPPELLKAIVAWADQVLGLPDVASAAAIAGPVLQHAATITDTNYVKSARGSKLVPSPVPRLVAAALRLQPRLDCHRDSLGCVEACIRLSDRDVSAHRGSGVGRTQRYPGTALIASTWHTIRSSHRVRLNWPDEPQIAFDRRTSLEGA